jgi:hypothetical protein
MAVRRVFGARSVTAREHQQQQRPVLQRGLQMPAYPRSVNGGNPQKRRLSPREIRRHQTHFHLTLSLDTNTIYTIQPVDSESVGCWCAPANRENATARNRRFVA